MIHKEKLDSLCHINSGGTPSRGVAEYYGGKIPWAKIGDIEKSNGVIYSTEEYITESGLESIGNRIFPKDTLLFAMYGSVGKVAFCGIELSTNQAILGIRLKQEAKEKLDLEYLKYWFQVNLLFFKSRAVGGILKNLSATIVRDFDIPLPSITDQKRIAKVLSECEDLIQKRKESIVLLDDLLNSTFMEVFKDELADKTKESWIPLGQAIELLADYHANGSYESLNAKITIKTEKDFALMVRTTDLEKNDFETDCRYLNEEEYNYLSKSKIFGNEIIITKIGSAGNVYLMPLLNRPVSLGMNAFLLRLKEAFEPIFIYGFLTTPLGKSSIMRNVKGAVTKTITKDAVRGIKIPKVDPKKQNDYKVIVEQVEPIKKQLKNSLKELENLYGSISQRAFNGELDLSKVDISDMEDSKKKDLEAVKEDLTEEQFEDLLDSFEHTLPTGEVPSNRETDIRDMSIRQYLRLPDDEATEGFEFSKMNKDYFYQFILTKGFPEGTFTLTDLEQYARKYILRGTGFEFTYENWKTIIFRFIGAKQPIIEQLFDEETKTIKLKLTDEAFKV